MGKLSLSSWKSYLLWACILLCLLPFVILSFFNFMAFDDYLLWDAYRDQGFFEAQKMIYLHWEGRFTANFVCGVFEVTGIVRHYYFLVFLLFAFFTWAALLLLLHVVNVCCLSRSFSLSGLVPASLILLIMDLFVMAEISSGVYWFSAAAVYQTAFILFLLLAACMVRRFAGRGGSLWRWDMGVVFLAILICGCNEIAAIALASCFLLVIGGCVYYRRTIPRVLFLYLGVVLLTGGIIASTSGVLSFRRTAMQGHTGYAGVVLILLVRGLSVFYYILKEPLFWACAVTSYIIGIRMSSVLESLLPVLRSRKLFIPGLLAIILFILCTLAPVLAVTHGSIPERAINNLTSLTAFYLLLLAFLSGACKTGVGAGLGEGSQGKVSALLVILLSCALLANYNYKEAWKNVIMGYFYHAIQVDRQKILLSARENHLRSATVPSYAVALEEKVRQVFPHGAPVTVQRLLRDRPTLLCFDNEAEEPLGGYLRYYRLDSIVVKQF